MSAGFVLKTLLTCKIALLDVKDSTLDIISSFFPLFTLIFVQSLPNHTIRQVKFLSNNSILTKTQHFHEFFTQFFLTIFLVKSKLSTAKKSKTTTFSRVFHPKKIDNFLGKSKLKFWTKNEDFEQCQRILTNFYARKKWCIFFCSFLSRKNENCFGGKMLGNNNNNS